MKPKQTGTEKEQETTTNGVCFRQQQKTPQKTLKQ